MSESLPEQRTEMPTDRRMGELRRGGQLHMSNDLVQVLTLLVGFLAVSRCVGGLSEKLQIVLIRSFERIGNPERVDLRDLQTGIYKVLLLIGPTVLLLLAVVAATAVLGVMLQTKWNRRDKWIKFNWAFLNPIAGLRRIFSIQGVFNTLKALVKLCLILPIGYFALRGLAPQMVILVNMSMPDILKLTTKGLDAIFWKILYVLFALALIDYFWGKHQWLKNVKMTKEEVKDERKATEGDEATKRKIIAKGLQRIAQRLSQSVPKADVVITNPTHFAVALKYDRDRFAAPIVVAKGQDLIALRIREIAREHGVPVLERKALARALYASTEVGKEIPRELFRAVAEVLAYVFKLKNPNWQPRSREAR